jgi:hypothetical protein
MSLKGLLVPSIIAGGLAFVLASIGLTGILGQIPIIGGFLTAVAIGVFAMLGYIGSTYVSPAVEKVVKI